MSKQLKLNFLEDIGVPILVPFVDEVEEFNSLMNKPNNYRTDHTRKKRMGIRLQFRTGRT